MNILVTGAAGYIGSVVTERLVAQGYEVVAVDDLRHGHREAVHPAARFLQGDLLDRPWLMAAVAGAGVDAVVHLAAEALIDVSVRDPGTFFQVNVSGGLNLLDAMAAAKVRRLIFSSTAAVYGEPAAIPIREDASLNATGVIMLTGIGERLNEMTSPLYGADDHLDKPFDFDELDQRVTAVLEKKGIKLG